MLGILKVEKKVVARKLTYVDFPAFFEDIWKTRVSSAAPVLMYGTSKLKKSIR